MTRDEIIARGTEERVRLNSNLNALRLILNDAEGGGTQNALINLLNWIIEGETARLEGVDKAVAALLENHSRMEAQRADRKAIQAEEDAATKARSEAEAVRFADEQRKAGDAAAAHAAEHKKD